MICDVRLELCVSDHKSPPAVWANETMDDGSWQICLCQSCADALGLRDGDEMPDDATERLRKLPKGDTGE